MRRAITFLATFGVFVGIAAFSHYNLRCCPVEMNCVSFYSKVYQNVLSNDVHPVFGEYSDSKFLDSVKTGQVKIASGEFFSSEEYPGLIKSIPYKECNFNLYYRNGTEIKKIGYTHGFLSHLLSNKLKKVELTSFNSNMELFQAFREKKIDAICIPDCCMSAPSNNFTLEKLNIKRSLVFLTSSKSGVDMNQINKQIKQNNLNNSKIKKND